MRFFVDTNFFLQCKNYKNVRWKDITEDTIIEIVIARPVQIEIDRFKSDGSNRRSRKARETSRFFKKIINAEKDRFEDSIGNVKIISMFADNYASDEIKKEGLDLSRPDDELIASIIKYNDEMADDKAYLLTHDTNPVLTAKKHDVPFKMIPDSWLLEPQKDNRDKTIDELKREIKSLTAKEPKIEAFLEINGLQHPMNTRDSLEVEIDNHIGLSNGELESLLDLVRKMNPLKTDFSNNIKKNSIGSLAKSLGALVPPSQDEIKKYIEELYPSWISEMRNYIQSYENKESYRLKLRNIKTVLKNTGSLPVNNLRIIYNAYGGMLLLAPDREEDLFKEDNPMPKKPTAPSLKFDRRVPSIFRAWDNNIKPADIILPKIPRHNRDRYGFYWKDRPDKEVNEWELYCEEFRHKLDPKTIKDCLLFPENSNDKKFDLKITVSGANMINPEKFHCSLKVKFKDVRIYDILANKLSCIGQY